jgi:Phage gp6-like head-tail connector protein
MTAPLYVTLDELKDRLRVTDTSQDFALERALDSACRWIENTLGRRFYVPSTPEVRYYTAYDCDWQVRVDDVLSVTELATDNADNNTYATIWTLGQDYFLEPRNALVKQRPYTLLRRFWPTGRFNFPAWENAVRLTSSTFAYCQIEDCPPEIREASLLMAESMAQSVLLGSLSQSGVTSYRIGTELSVTMDATVAANTRVVAPPGVTSLLDHFRRDGGYVY